MPTSPRCKSPSRAVACTAARSTARSGRGPSPPSGYSRCVAASSPTASPGLERGRRSVTRHSADASCVRGNRAGMSLRCSSCSRGTVSRPGRINGRFGAATDAALRRFQRWAGIDADEPGPATLAALRASPPRSPIPLAPPCARPDPRGSGRAGTASTAASTTRLRARPGAGGRSRPRHARRPAAGRRGNVVVIDHGQGVRTWYAPPGGPRPGRTARRAWGNDRSCGCKRPRNRAAPPFRGARPWCVRRPALGTGLSRSGRDNLRTSCATRQSRKSRVLGGRSGGVDPSPRRGRDHRSGA